MPENHINKNFELIACPVCNSNDFSDYVNLKYSEVKEKKSVDYSSLGIDSDTNISVKKCKKCKFVFTNPRLKIDLQHVVYNESKDNFYKKKDYLGIGTSSENLGFMRKKRLASFLQLFKILQEIDLNKETIKIFDYGSGFGNTLLVAKVLGIDGWGVDIDKKRLEVCNNLNLNVCTPDRFESSYGRIGADIITMQSCLEHLYDINSAMEMVESQSKEGTLFYVNGISPRLIDIEKKRGQFSKSDFVEHINYFPLKTADILMKRYNFYKIKDIEVGDMKTFSDFAKRYVRLKSQNFYSYMTGLWSRIYIYKPNKNIIRNKF